MASDQVLVNAPQVQGVPFDYQVPGSTELALQSVTAVFDGSGAGSSFLPALQIIGPGGVVAATFVDKDNAVTAGDSAEVTFGTFLRKQAAPCPPANPYNELITLLGVDAWWKQDETSGATAHDSSGNGHDISATTTDPTWQAWTAPTGTQGDFLAACQSIGGTTASLQYSPDLSGDFTFLTWIKTPNPGDGLTSLVASQSDPAGLGLGWSLAFYSTSISPPNRMELSIGNGAGASIIISDGPYTYDATYLYGFRHQGSVWTMFVNGVAQASTYSGTYAPFATRVILGAPQTGGEYLS